MTNEEIRNNHDKEWFNDDRDSGNSIATLFDTIQDLTRADERSKVIGEIEEYLKNPVYTQIHTLTDQYGGVEKQTVFDIVALKSKLNSLGNQK